MGIVRIRRRNQQMLVGAGVGEGNSGHGRPRSLRVLLTRGRRLAHATP